MSNSVSALADYSTTEQVVGTWLDGKPVYRKVCLLSGMIRDTLVEIPTGLQDVKAVIRLDAMIYANNNFTPIYVGTSYVGFCWYDGTNNTFHCRQFFGADYTNGFAIVEYTKTTD